MANGLFFGIDSLARKTKSGYIGIDGVAKKIKKIYVGIGDTAKLSWQSVIQKVVSFVSSLNKGNIAYTDGYLSNSDYSSLTVRQERPMVFKKNLYAMVYDKSYDGYEDEYLSSGILIVTIDDNGKPLTYRDLKLGEYSSSNVSGNFVEVQQYTFLDNNMLYAFGYTGYANTSNNTYYYQSLIYDYNTNRIYTESLGSGTSSSYIDYIGMTSAQNNTVISLVKDGASGVRTFSLVMRQNVAIGTNSSGATAPTYTTFRKPFVPISVYSNIFMCKIDDNSGLIIENGGSNNYTFYMYTLNLSSTTDKIIISNLGTYTLGINTLYFIKQIDINNYLMHSYTGDVVMITLSSDRTFISYTSVLSVLNGGYNSEIYRIGNSNTFAYTTSISSNVQLIYADVNNKTLTLLGTKTPTTKDHSIYHKTGCTLPFGEKSTITLLLDTNSSNRTATINGIVNTFE